MENPGADFLMEIVREIKESARRAAPSRPGAEDYLQSIGSDPVTEWFTKLLREKNEELAAERQRADRLVRALRSWYQAKGAEVLDPSASDADRQLACALRDICGIDD